MSLSWYLNKQKYSSSNVKMQVHTRNANVTFFEATVIFLVALRKRGKQEKQNCLYNLHFILKSVNDRYSCPFCCCLKW